MSTALRRNRAELDLDDSDEPVRVPASASTLSGFRAWQASATYPQRGRISYLAGVIEVNMSPEEIVTHIDPKRALTVGLDILVHAEDLGRIYMDGTSVVSKRARIANEPDLTYCSWETLTSGRVVYERVCKGKHRLTQLVGSPDLVVEIVSRSSVRKDTKILPERYFKAGVTEYWLVDCRDEGAKAHRLLDSLFGRSAATGRDTASLEIPLR